MGTIHGAVLRLSECLWLLRGVADRPARHNFACGLAAELLDCPREDVRLEADSDGPPRLVAPAPLHVSLSHRSDLTLVALSPTLVGVDVEWADARHLDVAADFFTAAEAAWLRQSTQSDAFARLWTAKEAVLKALGLGITRGMRQPDLSPLLRPGQPLDLADTALDCHGVSFQVAWQRLDTGARAAVTATAIADCHGKTAISAHNAPLRSPTLSPAPLGVGAS